MPDINGVKLASFDCVVKNSANVDYLVNGNQMMMIPNEHSNATGVLELAKSSDVGTPVAYKKNGQQTVMAGAIDEPTTYEIVLFVGFTLIFGVTALYFWKHRGGDL